LVHAAKPHLTRLSAGLRHRAASFIAAAARLALALDAARARCTLVATAAVLRSNPAVGLAARVQGADADALGACAIRAADFVLLATRFAAASQTAGALVARLAAVLTARLIGAAAIRAGAVGARAALSAAARILRDAAIADAAAAVVADRTGTAGLTRGAARRLRSWASTGGGAFASRAGYWPGAGSGCSGLGGRARGSGHRPFTRGARRLRAAARIAVRARDARRSAGHPIVAGRSVAAAAAGGATLVVDGGTAVAAACSQNGRVGR